MRTEILIIGGGVIGLSIAFQLRRESLRQITLIDQNTLGAEASWAAGGMLSAQSEADSPDDFFDLCRASLKLYPDLIDHLVRSTGIDAELDRTGTIKLAFSLSEAAILDSRTDWQRKAGLAVEPMSATDIRRAEPFISPNVVSGSYFCEDWQIDNRKLIASLRRYAELNDVAINENTKAESLTIENGRIVNVSTSAGRISAEHVVLATGAWTSLIKIGDNTVPVRVRPVRGQMLEFHTAKRLFRHVLIGPDGYLVPRADGRLIAGSTTENVGFDRSNTPEGEAAIFNMAVTMSPSIAALNVRDKWAGLRPMSADGLPVIGTIPGVDNLIIATAHYRNGILLAPVTADAVAKRILYGAESRWMTIFGPERLRFAGRS